jgi:hypothetical protein
MTLPVAVLPLLPWTILTLDAFGVTLGVPPDLPMKVIAVVQLIAAALALAWRRAAKAP